MSQRFVYLDHAAATPLDERVFLAMHPYFSDCFFNPSAPYGGGREARGALDGARETISDLLGAKAHDIVFTAGATESINLAVHGSLHGGGHAVLGALEHAAVRAAVTPYPHTFATCDTGGLMTVERVKAALRDDTVLVSIAYADSEFGVVQPLAEIGRLLASVRAERQAAGNQTPLYFHTDASQAATALDLTVSRLGVDMMTLNAAKCYGPKQVGLLWLASRVRLVSLMAGGGQERGLRSGTENVAGAVGFAVALAAAQRHRHRENKRLAELRQRFVAILSAAIPELVIDGHPKRQLAGHVHLHVPMLDAERVVIRLDMEGVYAATGAACAANKGTRSPALEAIGLSPTEADGSLRFSFGKLNSLEQIETVAPLIAEAITLERGL